MERHTHTIKWGRNGKESLPIARMRTPQRMQGGGVGGGENERASMHGTDNTARC